MPAPGTGPQKAKVHKVTIHVIEDAAVLASAGGQGGPLAPAALASATHHVKTTPAAAAAASDPRNIFIVGNQVLTSVAGDLVPHDAAIKKSMVRLWSELDIRSEER